MSIPRRSTLAQNRACIPKLCAPQTAPQPKTPTPQGVTPEGKRDRSSNCSGPLHRQSAGAAISDQPSHAVATRLVASICRLTPASILATSGRGWRLPRSASTLLLTLRGDIYPVRTRQPSSDKFCTSTRGHIIHRTANASSQLQTPLSLRKIASAPLSHPRRPTW